MADLLGAFVMDAPQVRW